MTNIAIPFVKNISKKDLFCLLPLTIDFFEFKRAISEQKIKDRLKFNTDEAYKKGIFGAPSFIVNNKLFWGQDRLEYALKEFEN